MYTCMCNWVPMLYSGGKKSVLGEITVKNKLKKKKKKNGGVESEESSAEEVQILRKFLLMQVNALVCAFNILIGHVNYFRVKMCFGYNICSIKWNIVERNSII